MNENNQKPDEQNQRTNKEGIRALAEFMTASGERLTWVECREIWNNMLSTDNGQQTPLVSTWDNLKEQYVADSVDTENGVKNVHHDNTAIARGIKDSYSIRLSDDHSELKFVLSSQVFLWLVVASIAIAGYVTNNPKLGTFSGAIFLEAITLFAFELVSQSFLSWIVLRFNIKINYTRKLWNLARGIKYFAADFLPFYKSTVLSMFTSLAVNHTLFCALFYRSSRERIPFFSFLFLCQDRREDRPDTLTLSVTEDILRCSIYFPFKIFVVNYIEAPAVIFIPIWINNIGDGLAEPVGVRFGKHKYSTTALYYKGKFWNGNFTRSYEGSSCVFLATVVIVAANYDAFTTPQFWLTVVILPFLMTIAEAKAPHTCDGPFLAFIGCGFLSAIFFLVP